MLLSAIGLNLLNDVYHLTLWTVSCLSTV